MLSISSLPAALPPHGHIGSLEGLLPLMIGAALLFLLLAASVVLNLITLGKSEASRTPLVTASIAFSALFGLLMAGVGVAMSMNPNAARLLTGAMLLLGPLVLVLAIATLRHTRVQSGGGGERAD